MSALPEVGRKYEHKKHGIVWVTDTRKRGRGHNVGFSYPPTVGDDWDGEYAEMQTGRERLQDFNKATQ